MARILALSALAGSLAGCDLEAIQSENGSAADEDLVEEAVFSIALGHAGEDEDLGDVPAGEISEEAEDLAEDDTEGEGYFGSCRLADIRHEVIGTYDDNGDGELDSDERAEIRDDFGRRAGRRHRHIRRHRLQRLRWIYDRDGDGVLSPSEREEARSDLETRCENRMAQLIGAFDANGDGELSDDEWLAIREHVAGRFEERRRRVLEEFDTNGDGRINLGDELQALRRAWRERIRSRRARIVAAFDRDGDGVLNRKEMAALKEFLRSLVRGEHFDDRMGDAD